MYKSRFLEVQKVNFDMDAFVKKISKMTDDNAHGHARIEIAKAFKMSKFEKIFDLINKIHTIEGHIPYNLMQYRDELAEEMLTLLKKEYGEDVFNKIKGAL